MHKRYSGTLLRWFPVLAGLFLIGAGGSRAEEPKGPSDKLHPALLARFEEQAGPVKTWVFFTDKGLHTRAELDAALAEVAAKYNPRAVRRRQMRGPGARGEPLFQEFDLPVAAAYLDAVRATGARVHVVSRWLNAASVHATRAQAEAIAALPFVERLQPVARHRRVEPVRVGPTLPAPKSDKSLARGRVDYGASTEQLEQINLLALHDAGYNGQGVVVGILDTGFDRSHEAFNYGLYTVNVIAEHDFVDGDDDTSPEPGDPSDQHSHGTMILGCLAAYKPGELVGGAYGASFILCKTEDTTQEVPAEEDNFVAGLEFIESNGGDMSTASLGYIDWYTQSDLDGQTAVTTIAVNISTSLGVHHCNAAGNEYHDSDPGTSSLIAPADAFQGITCGAVDSTGDIAWFSSDGPTADGRVKPELLARGVSTHTVSPYSTTDYTTADGTSLSTPLVACAVACLVQAHPYWTVDQMRQHLFETADYYVQHGTFDPLYVRGYGILDAYAAGITCSDAGAVALDQARYACADTVQVMLNDCGLNTDDNVVEQTTVAIDSESETGVEQVTLTETAPDTAEFVGTIDLSTTDAPGVLLVAEGDTVTVTYIDADDGQGGTGVPVTVSAVVDCSPPTFGPVTVTNLEGHSATITFTTSEPARGTVRYGPDCDHLAQTAGGGAYVTDHAITLNGLADETTYFFAVEAEDEAGNLGEEGGCYSFTTPGVPDYFTEVFASGFDLDGYSLVFTPDPGPDGYVVCQMPIDSLPTDPSGGTTLDLSDDDYTVVSVGGQTVSLYGVSYGSFFVGSNGYITFTDGDTDYTESVEDHFSLPRISALFDDLNPGAGGTVSYRQLADRMAVTYSGVPEYSSTGANTFQVEMFFDGRITISYLGITADDGLVGLSDGTGVPGDFTAMDLSALGGCVTPGDLNCDGVVNAFDIDPFILALTDPAAYAATYPDCDAMSGDINGDGMVNAFDIDPFVELLADK